MPSSRTSSSTMLVVVLWILVVGVVMLAGTGVYLWTQDRHAPLQAKTEAKKANKFTAEEQAQIDERIDKMQDLQELSLLMKAQVEFLGTLKNAHAVRKQAKKDDRLAELIDGFESEDAEIRKEHAAQTEWLESFREKRDEGIGPHFDKAVKTNAKIVGLLEMQQKLAKEDRDWVEANKKQR